jgi:exopolysaccharide biosynthesis predicted pyruvyltransferase EpsI
VQIMDSVPKMTGIITPKSVYYEEGKTLRKD